MEAALCKTQLPDGLYVTLKETFSNQDNGIQKEIPVGNNFTLGEVAAPLTTVTTPQRLILEVSVNNRKNDWNIWVYPTVRQAIPHENKICMTDRLDTITLNTLEKGATVLLSLKKGSLSKKLGGDIQIGFSSIFWNTAWTAKQAPHTLGILCNPAHPALSEFPQNITATTNGGMP